MSIDIIARALASQAGSSASTAQSNATVASQRAGTIDLFTNITTRTIDSSINLVSTGGYAAAGQGAARYVSDALATAALASAYPLLCKQSADGRYWRALPDAEGQVPVAAAGAIGWATPTHTTNQQPAIQQVIDYCYAVGAAGPALEANRHYSVWAPTRSASDTNTNTDKTGIPLLINRNLGTVGYCRVKGNGATIWRRMRDGSDPSVAGSWQTLTGGSQWRGGMFFLCGASTAPASYSTRTTLHLDSITVMGGVPFVSPGNYGTFYTATGQGWDITDKAICAEISRHTGDIILTGNIWIDGFGGEHLYQGGATHGSVYQWGGTLTSSNSNGDGFNPCVTYSSEGNFTGSNSVICGGTVRVESIRVRKCFTALEGSTGWNGRIGSIAIEDCDVAGGLMSGVWTQATQPTGLNFPTLTIDRVRAERSGTYSVLRGNRIASMTLVDTILQFGQTNIACYGAEVIEAEVMADKANLADGVRFFGTATSGSKGTYGNRLRLLRCSQSDNALAGSFAVSNPVNYSASLGDQNFVERITGYAVTGPYPRTPAGITDWHVGFGDLSGLAIQNPSAVQNIETTPALAAHDAILWVSNTSTTGLFTYSLPAMANKLPVGSRRRLIALATGTSVLALGNTNTRNEVRQLHRNGKAIEVEFDGFAWVMARPSADVRLSAGASLTWSAIANGATSAEQTITLNGVKTASPGIWRVYAVSSLGTWPAGVILNARISADNTIAVSVTNVSGASLTPPAGTVTAYAEAVT